MDIRIADSDAPNTQVDITQPCIWIRYFSKFNLPGPGLHCLTLITRAGSVLTVRFAIQLHLPVMKQPRPRKPAVLVSETRFNLFSTTWRGGAVWDHVVEIKGSGRWKFWAHEPSRQHADRALHTGWISRLVRRRCRSNVSSPILKCSTLISITAAAASTGGGPRARSVRTLHCPATRDSLFAKRSF